MPVIAENRGTAYPKAPEGVHRAVCTSVYDLGTQPGFEGEPTRKVWIMWELSDETMEDGRPFAVSEEYTLSLNEKANLRKKLEAWRGRAFNETELKGFDVANLLGKACQLQVVHGVAKSSGKTFAKVQSIMPLMKGMAVPDPVNPLRQFSITDTAVPEGTPEWIAKKIADSIERKGGGQPPSSAPAAAVADQSDVPF